MHSVISPSFHSFLFTTTACRRFTPLLIDLYKTLKQKQSAATNSTSNDDAKCIDDFEIVFCSMDKVQTEYDSYTSAMPWWCLPFQSSRMGTLANTYQCQGIPHLVILDVDGTVLHDDGVGEVSTDPTGEHFPWRPKPIVDILPEYYLAPSSSNNNNGDDSATFEQELSAMTELDDKYLMLYFSAHWCPPCRRFTPMLCQAYTDLKHVHGDKFELLFVSSDHDLDAFMEYCATMNFGAIPYHEREAKTALSKTLKVRGIPSLIMLGPKPKDASSDSSSCRVADRPIINDNVRACIERGKDYYVQDFPFYPKIYGDLNQTQENINTTTSIIIFHETGDDDDQAEVRDMLQQAAAEFAKNQDAYGGRNNVRFYWALSHTGLTKTVRDALKMGPPSDDRPHMVLLDIPDQGAFYEYNNSDSQEIDKNVILQFLKEPGTRKEL